MANDFTSDGAEALNLQMSHQPKSLVNLSAVAASAFGKPAASVAAVFLVVIWALSGPWFRYSATWQLLINTATSIVIFLMLFVMQNSQNRDGKAIQAKLDALILSSQAANQFIGIEKLDEKELRAMSDKLADKAERVERKADEKSAASDEAL